MTLTLDDLAREGWIAMDLHRGRASGLPTYSANRDQAETAWRTMPDAYKADYRAIVSGVVLALVADLEANAADAEDWRDILRSRAAEARAEGAAE